MAESCKMTFVRCFSAPHIFDRYCAIKDLGTTSASPSLLRPASTTSLFAGLPCLYHSQYARAQLGTGSTQRKEEDLDGDCEACVESHYRNYQGPANLGVCCADNWP